MAAVNPSFVRDSVNDHFNRVIVNKDELPPPRVKTGNEDYDLGISEEARKPFSEKTFFEKTKFVLWIGVRICLILGALVLFMTSLKLLSNGFILIGGREAGAALGKGSFLSHPICGLMMGVMTTAFLQSSSTSTSIVVTMIAAGIMEVSVAIPVIMGANIGTFVTSTIVAAAHVGNRKQFRDAFAAATVHDMFNWLSVFVLLPLELITHYLERLSAAIVNTIAHGGGGTQFKFINAIIQPIANLIVMIDKSVLSKIASGLPGARELPILKKWCRVETIYKNLTTPPVTTADIGIVTNATFTNSNLTQVATREAESITNDILTTTVWPTVTEKTFIERCHHMFAYTPLSESAAGALVLVLALVLMVFCLFVLVKCLKSLLVGPLSDVITKTINADFPAQAACFTGYLAMFVGMLVTILVQSSSVTTSVLTPLVGLGMVSVDRVFPMTLGANIGTTSTAFIAAIAATGDKFQPTLQIAICHLFFNLSGILVWYPVPFMRRVPLRLAKFLGETTCSYRWFAIAYLIFMFIVFPFFLFGISLNTWVLIGVGVPLLALVLCVLGIKLLQAKYPSCLPRVLQTWEFLPEPLRSLAPYDRLVTRLMGCAHRWRPCCKHPQPTEFEEHSGDVEHGAEQAVEMSEKGEKRIDNFTGSASAAVLQLHCGMINPAFTSNEEIIPPSFTVKNESDSCSPPQNDHYKSLKGPP